LLWKKEPLTFILSPEGRGFRVRGKSLSYSPRRYVGREEKEDFRLFLRRLNCYKVREEK